MNIKHLEGEVVSHVEGWVEPNEIAKRFKNPELWTVYGFVIHYKSGLISVIHGGWTGGGYDLNEFWILDKNGVILVNDKYTY